MYLAERKKIAEIKAMSDNELIVQFTYATANLLRGMKLYKADSKYYDDVGKEIVRRGILLENDVARIKTHFTL